MTPRTILSGALVSCRLPRTEEGLPPTCKKFGFREVTLVTFPPFQPPSSNFIDSSLTDVGGGAVPDSTENALGNVALRWMVEEVALSQCGIIFNPAALQRANIEVPGPFPNTPLDFREIASDTDSDSVRETLDALAPIDDQLKNPLWWILELLPIINSYQDERGKWHWRVL